jgi:putative membrane protein
VIEFAVVMAVIAAFIIVLVGGLEVIDQLKKRNELRVDPEQLLAARFARGEIDEAEYSRRLSVLRLGPPLEIPDLPH